MLRPVSLRALLARTSPVTLGLVALLLLVTGVRLAVARPTTWRLSPGPERPLEGAGGTPLGELQTLSATRGLAFFRGRSGGSRLLDWTRAEQIDRDSSLEGLEVMAIPQGRGAQQVVPHDGFHIITRGSANNTWLWALDESRERPERRKLPRDFLWLRPDGSTLLTNELQPPEGWPELHPGSIVRAGHLALGRPRVKNETKDKNGKTTVHIAQGNKEVLVFDARDGRGLERVETDLLRRVITSPEWAGFAWHDGSSSWLRYVSCDEAGQCRHGTSMLRAGSNTILGADLRHDLKRLAICTTRAVLLYEGVVDGAVRFLGRSPTSKSCQRVVITSPRGVALMLDDRKWVTYRMGDRP
jgi:hypothetical protein